jgi:hypothetical protein
MNGLPLLELQWIQMEKRLTVYIDRVMGTHTQH